MGVVIPVLVVILALIAAGSIAYVAWQLTSKDVQDELERALGPGRDAGNPAAPDATAPGPAKESSPGDDEPQGRD